MAEPLVTMQRYEIKYILSKDQVEKFKAALIGHMELDDYGVTEIFSLYYDTPDFRLIRNSIEKPNFKEKIRLRSYGAHTAGTTAFLELKRKADGIVYKRRMLVTENEAEKFFNYEGGIGSKGQIAKEITYFRDFYRRLLPACLIVYDREAYFERKGDLRLTLDYNIRYRLKDLNLNSSEEDEMLLPEGYAVLEIKVQRALPLWLTAVLSENKIYKRSFSKYGEAYKRQLIRKTEEDKKHV